MKDAHAHDIRDIRAATSGIDLSYYIRMIRRRLVTIVVVFIGSFLILSAYAYKQYLESPIIYISQFRIALKPKIEKRDARGAARAGVYVLSLDYGTQDFIKLIDSGSVLEKVARDVYGDEVTDENFDDYVRRWKQTADIVGIATRMGVFVGNPPDDNIITMKVADESPDVAFRIASEWLEVIQNESIAYKEDTFKRRLEVLEQQRDDAYTLLEDSMKEIKVLLDKDTMAEVIKAGEVALDEQTISSKLFDLKRESSSLKEIIVTVSEKEKESYLSAYNYILSVQPNLIDKTYRDAYQKQKNLLKELLLINTDEHPDVIEARRQLKITESKMSSEVERAISLLKIQYEEVASEQKRLDDLIEGGVFEDLRLYRQLQDSISEEKKNYQDLDKEISDIKLAHKLSAGPLFTVKTYPTKPTKPFNKKGIEDKVKKNFVFAFLLAAALSVGCAFLREAIDATVKDINDLEDIGWLVLTAIPFNKGIVKKGKPPLVIPAAPASIIAESIKLLRADLEFVTADSAIRVISITSSLTGEGATFVAMNLAYACAMAGKKTLLIEADFKKPKFHDYFNITKSESSLVNLAEGKQVVPFKTTIDNLWVIGASEKTKRTDIILKHEDIIKHIEAWKNEFDWIFFDCPSLQVSSNSGIIIKNAEGVMPVVLAHKTSKRMVTRLQYIFDSANLNVIGAVLNGIKKMEDSGLQYVKES